MTTQIQEVAYTGLEVIKRLSEEGKVIPNIVFEGLGIVASDGVFAPDLAEVAFTKEQILAAVPTEEHGHKIPAIVAACFEEER